MSEAQGTAAYEHNARHIDAAGFYAIACDPRRHVAVEACAGAGKTWMLVSRIVRALFEGMDAADGALSVQPHEILAITFTKRAASEMRERLYRWLEDFSTAGPEQLMRELRSRGVAVPNDAGAAQARVQRLAGLYRAVLQCPRPVQIRTFHSWFASLLRAAPIAVLQQLELPLQYELLEDDAPAKALVWRRFYQALLDQPPRKADFEAVVREHGRFQTEKALGVALDKRIEFTRADAAGTVAASVRHFHDVYPTLAGLETPAHALCSAAARARWHAWAAALARESNKTPQKAAQAIVDAIALWEALPADTDADAAGAAAQCLAALRRALFVAAEDRLNLNLVKFEAAQVAAVELAELCGAQHHHGAWLYQQRMTALTRVIVDAFAVLKRERGWVDMTDVERAAMTLLSDPELAGWVQERLDTHVRHLLIDEFQDTNPLQWQALVSWLGSYVGASGNRPSVFIVGDPKQSIYRFRRAEPQVFRAAQQFVVQGLGGDLLSCDHTRRNTPAVLDAVNAVMVDARENDHYDGFRVHTTDASDAGQVLQLPPIPRERPASAPSGAAAHVSPDELGWRDSLTEPREVPEETLRNREARQLAGWIAQALAQGLRPSDVMVLSRRRASLLPLQDALRVLHVPAHVGEKTALIDCCEVQDVIALLDVLVSPRHDLSMARVLRSPLFNLPDQALVDIVLRRRTQPLSWFMLLQLDWPADHALHGIGANLLHWKSLLDRLPAHDALQSIFSQQDVLARFAVLAPDVQRHAVLANLRALLAASLQVAGGRFISPYTFVRSLKAGGVMAPATVAEDAVRLLTVHGAKGLEAQAVVLLDTDTPPRVAETMGVLVDWPAEQAHPQKFFFVSSEARPAQCAVPTRDHEQLQRRREELNALYVAMTRARRTLVVSSIEPHRDAPGSWWRRIVDQVTHLVPAEVVCDVAPVMAAATQDAFDLRVLPEITPSLASADAAQAVRKPEPGKDEALSALVGQAMHRLLEWGTVDTTRIGAVRREFGLDGAAADRAAAMAQRILNGAAAWAWDDTQLAWHGSEVELVRSGAVVRLDRLVQRKDNGQWWVLDHKSGLAPQDDPALVAQLSDYRAAVQAIYPGAIVRAAFLNGQGQCIELPEMME